MKNNGYIAALNRVAPDGEARARMLSRVLEARRAQTGKGIHMNKTVKWLAPAAACLVLAVAAAAILPRIYGGGKVPLPPSSGNVKVRYIEHPPMTKTSPDLVSLTEDEIFSEAWASAIFYGTVVEIRNIALDFNGEKAYRAIAKIEVKEVYRGDIAPGDVISVLLNCPVDTGVWVEDTEVTSQLREGMTGIFLPRRYTKTDFWEQNGATLLMRDAAPYGMGDGERFAFLETPGGLAYAAWAFPSLPEHASLGDVQALIARYTAQE